MKKVSIVLFLIGSVFWACQAGEQNSLDERVNALEKELATLKKVLKVVAKLDIDEYADKVDEMVKKQELEEKAKKEAENKVHSIPVGDSPLLGNQNAPITIVEFSDFECPYCAKRAPSVKALQKKYPGKIKVVFKHFPLSFHKNAPAASAASIAAQKQGKFWEYRFKLAPFYRTLTADKFISVAKDLKLDIAKFKKDMKVAGANQAAIDKDMALGSSIGVRGTPAFYVNGKTAPNFEQVVEGLVAKMK